MKFADIALPLPVNTLFTYKIPDYLQDKIVIGMRVYVPFKNNKLVGFVLSLREKEERLKLKEIDSVVDSEPVINKELIKLAEWISSYYFSSIGLTLRYFVPSVKSSPKKKNDQVCVDKESITIEVAPSPFKLTEEQSDCLKLINQIKNKFEVVLIHGVTGSGKTEIYLQSIAEVIADGKKAIIMVPEISLTPQTISRFASRFGRDNLAVLHSRLGAKKRMQEWTRIKNGQVSLVIGARSAVFAPIPDLGIIVIDEEHEHTYKQEESPRYHARNVAIMRAKACNALVVLGSATPSMESFYNVEIGKYKLINLTKRIENSELPKVEIVDIRKEIAEGNLEAYSRILLENIRICLEKKEQIILFQNRRGFSSFILCRKCGNVIRCKNCEVSLTYYMGIDKLKCHYCGHAEFVPEACPSCDSDNLHKFGFGTEKIEANIKELFPNARVARLDMEVALKKGEMEKILNQFQEKEIDILIGTQIIAKGHDFPNVTLVGVIFADTSLNLPDFRASERTFQLLTQVAGRAGRGSKPGKVIIQTYNPEHYSISYACMHDFNNFYKEEIKYRKALLYPPINHLVNVMFKGKTPDKTINAAYKFVNIFKKYKNDTLEILGPAPAVISKIKNFYRFQLIIKGTNRNLLHSCLLKTNNEYDKLKELKSVSIGFDIDPIDLM